MEQLLLLLTVSAFQTKSDRQRVWRLVSVQQRSSTIRLKQINN